MKIIRPAALTLFAVALGFLGQISAEAQLKIDCKSVAERVQAAIEAKPDQVLTIVEDALVAYSGCVDAIVKTAIETTKADAARVKQIVLVAVTTAEKDAPQIAESAVAAAPDHADAVREAFAEAFEKKLARDAVKTVAIAKTAEPDEVATTTAEVTEPKAATESATEIGGETVTLAKIPDYIKKSTQPIRDAYPEYESQNQPHQTSAGKAVIGEVSLGGKNVVSDSGRGIVEDGGKAVIYENGINYLEGGNSTITDGKSVVYDGMSDAYDGKAVADDGGYATPGLKNSTMGYGPVDLAGFYLIPPTATAAPIVEKEVVTRFKTRNRFITRNRTVTRSIPMSPTAP